MSKQKQHVLKLDVAIIEIPAFVADLVCKAARAEITRQCNILICGPTKEIGHRTDQKTLLSNWFEHCRIHNKQVEAVEYIEHKFSRVSDYGRLDTDEWVLLNTIPNLD